MQFPKTAATLKRQIGARIKSLGEAGIFMSGSFCEKRWTCARPECICNRTGKKHTAYAVTSKKAFGTRGYAGQNYYLLVQIAEIIRTAVIVHTNLFRRLQQMANGKEIKDTIQASMLK